MKNIFKVTILFCLIVGLFVIPAFADSYIFPLMPQADPFNHTFVANYGLYLYGRVYYQGTPNEVVDAYKCASSNTDTYVFRIGETFYGASESSDTVLACVTTIGNENGYIANTSSTNLSTFAAGDINLYYRNFHTFVNNSTIVYVIDCPVFNNINDALISLRDFIDNPVQPEPEIIKNANVDEFIANTLISMGVKFDTPAYALSYASAAWDWCIDEENAESAHPFDEWNIESFVSYCNAQSNNYLNWYNGYKVSEDVTKALGEYIRQNIRSLTGLPEGVTSLSGAYLPIYHYGSGFQSGVSSPTAQTFYPAQTITYFNGEYVNETNDISTSQFLYSSADVRRFLGYPATGSVVIPSDPAAGTGTITNDPNNPDQKNIEINFPSLGWLADAINSILDFLRDAFTTLANLLTQLLDAILGLFSDAFSSLADFGQGIIDFLQSVFAGLSTLLNGYVPSDLAVIIACFIALNFGIGLITFILKGH